MKKVFYTFALLAGSLMSCESSSDDETNPPDTATILPTKVDIVYSDGETETIQYTYSGMTLVKAESTDDSYTDYMYDNGKLTEINYYSSNPDILESYTYDAQVRVATISTNIVGIGVYDYSVSYNSDNSVITYTYTGDGISSGVLTLNNGNISTFEEGGLYNSTYTYDNKNAPFKNIDNREVLLSINSENNYALDFTLNNMLSETYATPNDDYIYTYTYTYTDFDFPRVVTENDEGDITTYTCTYHND